MHRACFFCGVRCYNEYDNIFINSDKVKKLFEYFQSNGLEVGVWIDGFGHGGTLLHDKPQDISKYTPIEGVDGRVAEHALCPEDENFASEFAEGVAKIAKLSPDLIMLDDDFRFNVRAGFYDMGCFCKYHYKRYCELVGEEVPRDQIKKLVFTGEKNKYRDAYYDMISESLVKFAKRLRKSVDEVNPSVRLGACYTLETFDTNGADLKELSYALAGNTKPFARLPGAPYWNVNVIPVIESVRMLLKWAQDSGVELCVEGDTYPRPRYNVPSKSFEIYDFLLKANGEGSAMFAYLFDYNQKPDYETGYLERFVRNIPKREAFAKAFEGKKKTGVWVYNVQHKVRNYSLPNELIDGIFTRLEDRSMYSQTHNILSQNGICTAYEKTDYPVVVFGENAKYIDKNDLKNGAIVDIAGAKFLQDRGIDVGLISAKQKQVFGEYYKKADDTITSINHKDLQEITVKDGAEVETIFNPGSTPASYRYTNADGIKFFVLAYNAMSLYGEYNKNYLQNYYRQEQLISAIEWLCGKKLPVVSKKNPNLYFLVAKEEDGSCAVAVANVYYDDIYNLEIELDKEYENAEFIGIEGKLAKDKIVVPYLPAYATMVINLK